MNRRPFSACIALALVFAALFPVAAAPKKHSLSARAKSHSKAQAVHLARLAAKQKAAWRAHLAKARELPRVERLALKRHERRLKTRQTQAQAPKKAPPAKAMRQAKKVQRQHQAQMAALSGHEKRLLAQHNARLARQATKRQPSAASAHDKRLAAQQKAHRQNLAQQQAAHRVKLAQQRATHNAKLAQQRAAHNARLASKRARWVAGHGDGSGGRSIKFWQTVAASVPVKVITVDLNDPNVKVSAVMARRGDGTAEPFRQMIERANPNVAVTGTFFSLDNLKPIGDIVVDGSLVHFGGMGTALCITPRNRAQMVTVAWGRHHDWSDYDFVCACGPRLLRRGRVVLDPHAERFKDKHMLAPNSRIGVGVTRGNKLVFVMTRKPIYLGRLAKVMRALGVSEAMNLDAGTSTGFYYNGATLARPGRSLTNMIVVYGRKDRYERALDQLVPASYRRASR